MYCLVSTERLQYLSVLSPKIQHILPILPETDYTNLTEKQYLGLVDAGVESAYILYGFGDVASDTPQGALLQKEIEQFQSLKFVSNLGWMLRTNNIGGFSFKPVPVSQ